MKKKLFVFAGEPSGDMHGGNLAREILNIAPNIRIEGVAGPKMRAQGVTGPLTMEDFAVMGVSDVVRSLPRLIRQFYQVRDAILKAEPEAAVLIDYADFNLRMAKALRKHGYKGKIIQYISPSVWAWGKHRIGEMAATLDLLLTIYPFELDYFTKTSLDVKYVGSPVKEQVCGYKYNNNWKDVLSIPHSQPLVALFPGSRKNEIDRNLPIILAAAAKLSRKYPEAIFGISCFNENARTFINNAISGFPEFKGNIELIPKEYTYELMRDSRCAVAKSGTVTLELALHQCPSVAVYKTSQINRWYAKYIMKAILPYYCIVNILAGKEIFPELIKSGLNADGLYRLLDNMYSDSPERKKCIHACQALTSSLGTKNTSASAADAILRLFA